ncbi:MAG TPA: adenosylcobinamide amidohydrolase [Methanomicrobiales archaeon]|jgi:adenosylcobinamide hydrolase|nr:adenosylcobinamide amidohydrolase [Methanomicrobiales archaeon]
MRYFFRGETLFLRGDFRAASTGVNGGLRGVTTIFNHTVDHGFDHANPARAMEDLAAGMGFSRDFFGLLTAVDIRTTCILHYDFITLFVTAGITNRDHAGQGGADTINIIVHSAEGFTDGALLGAMVTATMAKADALRDLGLSVSGTPTDAVVVASEGPACHEYAGTATEAGRRIHGATFRGVQEALARHEGRVERKAPSMFVCSRYGGDHWVEWEPVGCPYYPCHFEGQRCDFCYCPLYPCLDPSLGTWVESRNGGRVWNCSGCTLLHTPKVAAYLRRNPEAGLAELKRVAS